MGNRLKNAPVFYTLAQVKFNPILAMNTFIPQIQDRFRHLGYPDFKEEVAHLITLQMSNDDSSRVNTVPGARWIFTNAELTAGLILTNDSLVYHTTSYETFDVFREHLAKGLDVINQLVGLNYTERVGMRYLDAIAPRDGESLDLYLVPSFLGLARALNGSALSHSFCETVLRTSLGTLVSRVVIQLGPIGLSPDLLPFRLKVDEKFAAIQNEHAILDNDHFFEGRNKFSLVDVEKCLVGLHGDINEAFRLTATDHARSVWS